MSCLPVSKSAGFYAHSTHPYVQVFVSPAPCAKTVFLIPQPTPAPTKCSEEDLKYHQAMVNVRRQKASAEDLEIIKQWKNKKNPYR